MHSVQRAACKAVCAHGGVSVSKGEQSTQSSLHVGVQRGSGTHTWMGVWALCTSVCKHNGSVSVQGDVSVHGGMSVHRSMSAQGSIRLHGDVGVQGGVSVQRVMSAQ